jgi:hypothetical protein
MCGPNAIPIDYKNRVPEWDQLQVQNDGWRQTVWGPDRDRRIYPAYSTGSSRR